MVSYKVLKVSDYNNANPEQEPGMRFNYDGRKGQLHKIAQEITRSPGEDVSAQECGDLPDTDAAEQQRLHTEFVERKTLSDNLGQARAVPAQCNWDGTMTHIFVRSMVELYQLL